MKKIIITLTILIFGIATSQKQKSAQTIKEKFENRQGQDFSVPPPPRTPFPAQYPKGNKLFLEEVGRNLDRTKLRYLPEKLATQITLKIDSDGNIINVSSYGKNEIFNLAVKEAADKTTKNVIWKPGSNNRGEKVVDIVRLPFKFNNK